MVGRETPDERTLEEAIACLYSPGARAELLRVLTSPPHVRADVIRQIYERPANRSLAELLIDLEDDEIMRARVIESLRRL